MDAAEIVFQLANEAANRNDGAARDNAPPAGFEKFIAGWAP